MVYINNKKKAIVELTWIRKQKVVWFYKFKENRRKAATNSLRTHAYQDHDSVEVNLLRQKHQAHCG
jgi:hypothetical protein